MNRPFLGLTLAIALSIAAPALADVTTLQFDFLNGTKGVQDHNPQVFSAEGAGNSVYKITELGNGPALSCQTTNLYVKDLGPGERGLGLTNDPSGDHEIGVGSYIQSDFGALKSQIGAAHVTFQVGSVQANEGFTLYGSNSPNFSTGGGAVALWSVTNTTNHDAVYSNTFGPDIFSKYRYFDLTATGGGRCDSSDVLLTAITVRAVPEPGSVALLGVGLIGVVALARKRRRVA